MRETLPRRGISSRRREPRRGSRLRFCSGILKPDVIFFGEALPRRPFWRRTGVRATATALVVGSSRVVYLRPTCLFMPNRPGRPRHRQFEPTLRTGLPMSLSSLRSKVLGRILPKSNRGSTDHVLILSHEKPCTFSLVLAATATSFTKDHRRPLFGGGRRTAGRPGPQGGEPGSESRDPGKFAAVTITAIRHP
jgi:hypothetical protein